MPLRYPTAGTPYTGTEVTRALLGLCESPKILRDFEDLLQDFLGVRHLALVNSGTTAFYLLLEVFKQLRHSPRQDEVILPAYTAPSLLLPIRAAGLRPVLVDTDPQTFNLAVDQVSAALSERTLAVMPVHMFGLPCELDPLIALCQQRSIFLAEDAASSLGTKLGGRMTGTLAPFGFYSLNRGKNISTLTGGIITWKDERCTPLISAKVASLKQPGLLAQKLLLLKIIGLSLAVRPLFYSLLLPMLSRYKYTTLHTTFDSYAFPPVQAAFGKAIWPRAESLTQRRILNGQILYAIFRNQPAYQVPLCKPTWEVAFNQFPIIVKELRLRSELQQQLLAAGIETSLLYERPLHHIFPELNPTGGEPFPNATYLAKHLLLIPPHSQMRRSQFAQIRAIVNALT